MNRTGRVLPRLRRLPLVALIWMGLGCSAVWAASIPASTGEPSGVEFAIWESPAGFSAFSDTVGSPESRVARLVPPNLPDLTLSPKDASPKASAAFVRLPPLPRAGVSRVKPDESSGPMLSAPAVVSPVQVVPKLTPPSLLPAVVEKLPLPLPPVEKDVPSSVSLPTVEKDVPSSVSLPTVEKDVPSLVAPRSVVDEKQAKSDGGSSNQAPLSLPIPFPTNLRTVPAEEGNSTAQIKEDVSQTLLPTPNSPAEKQEASGDKMPLAAISPKSEAVRSTDMELVAQEADKHTRSGLDLAGRGAHFAARAELLSALRLVAQGLDDNQATNSHSRALADALLALRECEDFIPHAGHVEADLDLTAISRTHRTPVLHDSRPDTLTSLDATRRYLTFAQERLAAAAGHEVAGSMALFGLGKLHAAMAGQPALRVACAESKAMAFYQASLVVYPNNYMASNELGVLLARGGLYADARIALEHSVSTTSHAPGWRNLAVVYRHLGENALAQQAERMVLAAESSPRPGRPQSADQPVQWTDPQTFAQSFAETPAARQPLPARPAQTNSPAAPPTEKRAASRWWPFANSPTSETRQ